MKHAAPEHDYSYEMDSPAPSLAHILHVLRGYIPTILLTLAAVTVGYAIFATARYLLSPAERRTSQAFRLEFKGATEGEYPNGVKFSPAEILSTPVLLRVYNDNDLQRFISFPDFSRSLFVHDSNPDYERIASEYRSRLADPKLTPIDRDRITAEFESKRASLSKGDLAIHYVRPSYSRDVPEIVIRKVLTDILTTWANRAVREQRVAQHRVAILSPDIVTPSAFEQAEPIAAILVLRLKSLRLMKNLGDLDRIPGSELARTPNGSLSLDEIRTRLDELLRFRLEPLVPLASVADPATARRFLEAQLAYDQRDLNSRRQKVEAVRESISAYANQQAPAPDTATRPAPAQQQPGGPQAGAAEAVTPQLSEGFLERLVTLANQSTDLEYRQALVTDLRIASEQVIPSENAVLYDQNLLQMISSPRAATSAQMQTEVRQQIEDTRREIRQLISSVNDLHRVLSANLHPSTQFFSLTGTATTAVERGVDVGRLAGMGLLLLLLTLPLTIVLCLLHNKIREQEAEEHGTLPVHATAAEG